jgi:hypothetical protein
MQVAVGVSAAAGAAALPDAQIAAISARGADFREGDRVQLVVEVRNGGDATLPTVPVALRVDESAYAEWILPRELAPDQSSKWEATWIATRGGHVFAVTVDPLNDVVESDETNNSSFISFGAGDERRPVPWPLILIGAVALAVGVALGGLFRRVGTPTSSSATRPK